MPSVQELLKKVPDALIPEEGREANMLANGHLPNGATSRVYVSADKKYVLKHVFDRQVKSFTEYNCAAREAVVVRHHLAGCPWVPPIIYADSDIIISVYCGEPIAKGTVPADWRPQMNQILDDMKSRGVKHNDIKAPEVLVKDGKIYLCDFGWASVNEDFSVGVESICAKEKPHGIFIDKDAFRDVLKRLVS